jgi:uncharacterized membrane protein
MDQTEEHSRRGFPPTAGFFLGLGLGGFFDGIIFHQVLQWHQMLTSAGYPADNVRNLQINTLWDGLFHITTYIFVAVALFLLWRTAQQHVPWSGKLLVGTILMGFGIFNGVEGLVDHHLLGIHHVNETVPPEQWIFRDIRFLLWGVAMLVGGWLLFNRGKYETGWEVGHRSKQAGLSR